MPFLKDIGASWDRPGPFLCQGKTMAESSRIVAAYTLHKFHNRAAEGIEKSFGGATRIALKDPRLCLLLPLWTQALAALGYASRLVFIYRNPLEVAASIHRRNQIPARRGLQLWLYYNLRCLQDAESLGGIARVASFHALLDDPEGVAAVLAFILCHRRSTIKGPQSAYATNWIRAVPVDSC
jgi:hypothetical protein